MNTVDRYIARLYALNILTLFVLIFSFVVTIDVFINLSRYWSNAADRYADVNSGGEPGTVHQFLLAASLVVDLWGPRLLQLFNYLVGVVLVAAMGFTCVQLVRHREFVALLASGVSLHRIARPFIVVAVLVGTLQVVNQEAVVPSIAPLLVRDIGESGRRSLEAFQVALPSDDEGRLFYARRYEDETRTLHALQIFERDPQTTAMARIVSAERAVWDGSGWNLVDGRATMYAPVSGGAPTTIGVERVVTSFDPTRIKIYELEGYEQNLGWLQITRILRDGGVDPMRRRSLEQARWGRMAAVVSNVITVLCAMPFFLRRMPGPMMGAALKASPIAVGGLLAAAAAPAVSLPGLPAWLSAFVPALLLAPIGIALFSGLRT